MTIDTTNMCSHLQKKLFEEDGIYHRLWLAVQDDSELTAVVRSRQLHVYRNGKKVLVLAGFYSPIQPEPNYYNYWCQRVHGILQDDTDEAPVFSKVWQQLEDRIVEVYFSNLKVGVWHAISNQENDDIRYQIATLPFVAHNARFDEGCLKAVFKVYQMDYPDYRFYDTQTASRRQFGQSLPNHQLQTVAASCGYDLQNHHHALADAEACAAIALYLL